MQDTERARVYCLGGGRPACQYLCTSGHLPTPPALPGLGPSTRQWARWQQGDGHASATRVVARPTLAAHGQGYEARSRMPNQ